MTEREAINRIKDHIRVHKIGVSPHIYIGEALNMAINSLAKQIPQKVDTTIIAKCPVCDAIIDNDFKAPDYCEKCGQALEWGTKE